MSVGSLHRLYKSLYLYIFTLILIYFKDSILDNSRLCNRGPDGNSTETIDLSDNESALFMGHVLHLRGDKMADQPAKDSEGNLLLWNGEIFSGINVRKYRFG